ncbi:MAG: histidine--tRNA ligase [Candidatus Hydrogenedentota bacterium]
MTQEMTRVEPRTLKGFQDFLPADISPRRQVLDAIERIFRLYGFAPLETPALEALDALLGAGGAETNKELFRLESPEQEPIALRFDLTVPFARLMAQYPAELKPPFRRYAMGPVWRADKPGPGRFRQFTQCDIDIAGAPDPAADAEIIAIMGAIMAELGVTDYAVILNHRKLIDALLEGVGITEEARQKHVLRIIDKLQKVGEANVRRELGPGRVDDSGDPIPGAGLEEATIEAIMGLIAVTGETRAEVVANLEQTLPDSDIAAAALADLREIDAALGALGVDEPHGRFVPSLARGLDYYTGPVFEMILPSAPEFGSVMGGGRYDELVARFLDRPIPATGMSVGLDRLMAALDHLGVLPEPEPSAEALIVSLGNVPKSEALRAAAELRQAGIRTEPYFGEKKGMRHQLSHADRRGIPVAVILGEDELAQGVVAVKDLLEGKRKREAIADHESYRKAGKTSQVTINREDLVSAVRSMLEA